MSKLDHLRKHRAEIEALCRGHHVHRLALFGSVARGDAGDDSDYDFLVRFAPLPPGGYADAFFGLKEGLEALLGAPVDLVVESAIRNPYFKLAISLQQEFLYAA